jgi:hypothetical protein
MSDLFPTIADFVRCKEKCFFCGTKLKCRLTNFIGFGTGGDPLISTPLEGNKFVFDLSHTTASYELKVKITINVETNIMTFLINASGTLDIDVRDTKELGMPNIDMMVAKEVFADLRPYIQLYCPYKKCPYQYTVAGDIFKFAPRRSEESYLILPFKLYYESFVDGKLWVQNDYIQAYTGIYSRVKENATPLIAQLMDFEAMGQKKLLMRVKTLVTFS